jgi:arylsulfatase A-like enzyme
MKPKQHVDGKSLVPLLKNPSASLNREAIYWHYPHYGNQGGLPGSSLRAGDYKLLERFEDNSLELYNLKEDIGEIKNLSKEMPEKVAQLKKMLDRWRDEVNAKMMSPNPKYRKKKAQKS